MIDTEPTRSVILFCLSFCHLLVLTKIKSIIQPLIFFLPFIWHSWNSKHINLFNIANNSLSSYSFSTQFSQSHQKIYHRSQPLEVQLEMNVFHLDNIYNLTNSFIFTEFILHLLRALRCSQHLYYFLITGLEISLILMQYFSVCIISYLFYYLQFF